MARKDDFDWLDDPFNDKKAAEERQKTSMSAGAKAGIGCGCLVVVVGIVLLIAFVLLDAISILGDSPAI